jgi:DNA-binding MarR family transcriptional regulator
MIVALLLCTARMTYDPDEQPTLGFLLVRLGEAIDRRFVASMAELDLRPRELRVLVLIDRHAGCSQRELATRLVVDPANLVELLDRLEARRLIARRPASDDRRRRTLRLTPKGHRLLARATAASHDVERNVLAPLHDDQRAALETIALQLWHAGRREL